MNTHFYYMDMYVYVHVEARGWHWVFSTSFTKARPLALHLFFFSVLTYPEDPVFTF